MMRTCVAVFGAALAAGSLALAGSASAGVAITYYTGFTDTGTGVTVDPATRFGTGAAPSIDLGDLQPSSAINTAANWPGGSSPFAAILDETIYSKTGGTYSVSLDSDDGSYLYVNGVEALNDGGTHAQDTVTGLITLAAGLNKIEVQYDNSQCCTATVLLSGLPASAAGIPEPATWAMLILGLFGTGAVLRGRGQERRVSPVIA
jgi:hypothetical protein